MLAQCRLILRTSTIQQFQKSGGTQIRGADPEQVLPRLTYWAKARFQADKGFFTLLLICSAAGVLLHRRARLPRRLLRPRRGRRGGGRGHRLLRRALSTTSAGPERRYSSTSIFQANSVERG